MKRKGGFDKSIILLLIIIFLLIGASFFIYAQFKSDKIADALDNGDLINTAFFISHNDRLLFTEVLLYHPETKKAALLDIPRELGSIIKSEGKIDSIEVLYRPGNVGELREKIEELTGEEIPFYFEMSVDDVEKLVDLLEGIEMFIANPVEIFEEDSTILIPSGSLLLDGGKVKNYLLYDGDEQYPEIERIGRKQKFIQALLYKLGEKYLELQTDEVFPYFTRYIDTNFEKQSILSYIEEMQKLDVERIIFQRVLGVRRDVDGKTLLFPHYEGKLLKETVKQTIDSLASNTIPSNGDLTISIEILNGTPRNGLASRTSQVFKSFGYDVVHVGNADHFSYEQTTVIDRVGDINKAQKIASVINCKRIDTEISEKKMTIDDIETNEVGQVLENIDVTVILGKDFDGRYCKN